MKASAERLNVSLLKLLLSSPFERASIARQGGTGHL